MNGAIDGQHPDNDFLNRKIIKKELPSTLSPHPGHTDLTPTGQVAG